MATNVITISIQILVQLRINYERQSSNLPKGHVSK